MAVRNLPLGATCLHHAFSLLKTIGHHADLSWWLYMRTVLLKTPILQAPRVSKPSALGAFGTVYVYDGVVVHVVHNGGVRRDLHAFNRLFEAIISGKEFNCGRPGSARLRGGSLRRGCVDAGHDG